MQKIRWKQSRNRYEGFLTDGRLLCILSDVFEANRNLFSEEELHNPDEWLSSADGENCWIENIENVRYEVGMPIMYQINGEWVEA